MNKEEAIKTYEAMARPPKDVLRTITGGKLNGKTDINPQWRYKEMTQTFGLVGIGWKYDIQRLWTEAGANGEIMAFAQVAVYVKDGDKWSDPILGVGGSGLIKTEKGALVSNDEGYKMAVTDAFSASMKMLGVAADIYAGRWDGSKYTDIDNSNVPTAKPKTPYQKTAQSPAGKTPPVAGVKPASQLPQQNKYVFTPAEKKEMRDMTGSTYFTAEETAAYTNRLRNMTVTAKDLLWEVRHEYQKRITEARQNQNQQTTEELADQAAQHLNEQQPAQTQDQAPAQQQAPAQPPAEYDIF